MQTEGLRDERVWTLLDEATNSLLPTQPTQPCDGLDAAYDQQMLADEIYLVMPSTPAGAVRVGLNLYHQIVSGSMHPLSFDSYIQLCIATMPDNADLFLH